MVVEKEVLERCVVLRLEGRIDGSDGPEAGRIFRELTDAENFRLVVNMKGASYTSSAFLREMLAAWKTCRRWNRGDLRLCEIQPSVMKVLILTGLDRTFVHFETEAAAVESW